MSKWDYQKHAQEWKEYKAKHKHDRLNGLTPAKFYQRLYEKFRASIINRERREQASQRIKHLSEKFARYR